MVMVIPKVLLSTKNVLNYNFMRDLNVRDKKL